MPYIGVAPSSGLFKKLDAITVVNGQAAYTMNYNSSAYYPSTANALLVSVNGVIQAAEDAYTISGSTITFTENLVTGDTIDFIIALGDVGNTVTPVDGSVTTAKLANDAVTSDKLAHDIAVQTSLSVPTIKDSSGTNTAMTIDSSGNLSIPEILKVPSVPYALVDFGGSAYVSKTAGSVLDFDNIVEQNGTHYSTSNYEFTCPVDGIYMISCGWLTQNTSDQVGIDVEKNGTRIFRNISTYRSGQFTNFNKCSANDTLRLKTSGAETIYEGTGTDRYSYACYALLFGN